MGCRDSVEIYSSFSVDAPQKGKRQGALKAHSASLLHRHMNAGLTFPEPVLPTLNSDEFKEEQDNTQATHRHQSAPQYECGMRGCPTPSVHRGNIVPKDFRLANHRLRASKPAAGLRELRTALFRRLRTHRCAFMGQAQWKG